MDFKPLARVLGNAGLYFVTPYIGSGLAEGIPNFQIALWTTFIGLVLSASREAIEYGKTR